MSYDVKFSWKSGKNLVFAAFQPDGTGRGIENQPMYERFNTGFYHAEPATDLEEGDVVQVYELYTLYYDDVPVSIETYQPILYEGEQVYYEGEPLYDLDNTYYELVTANSRPIGSGEFDFSSGGITDITDAVGALVDSASTVVNVYDETTGAAGGYAITSSGAIVSDSSGDC